MKPTKMKLASEFMKNYTELITLFCDTVFSRCIMCPHKGSHLVINKPCEYKHKCYFKKRRLLLSKSYNIVTQLKEIGEKEHGHKTNGVQRNK